MKKRLLIGASVAVAAVLFAILPRTQYAHPDPVGPSVYSKSALGHAALLELLVRLDIPATASETGSGGYRSPNTLLVIGEPAGNSLEDVKAMLVAENVLLVLPKRSGVADDDRPNWVGRTHIEPIGNVLDVLHLVDDKATVVRGGSLASWNAEPFASGRLDIFDAQLIRSPDMTPLLAGPEGILIGSRTIGRHRVTVLSDPDLLANFSLTRGDNAVAAVNLILKLRKSNEDSVVFDEFEHGFSERPFHMLGILFQFPFSLVTMQIGVAAALLIWAATARFGSPASRGEGLDAGKRSLIEAGARLLDGPARSAEISARYVEAMQRETARNVGRAIEEAPAPELPAASNPTTALGNAQRIFVWRKELTR